MEKFNNQEKKVFVDDYFPYDNIDFNEIQISEEEEKFYRENKINFENSIWSKITTLDDWTWYENKVMYHPYFEDNEEDLKLFAYCLYEYKFKIDEMDEHSLDDIFHDSANKYEEIKKSYENKPFQLININRRTYEELEHKYRNEDNPIERIILDCINNNKINEEYLNPDYLAMFINNPVEFLAINTSYKRLLKTKNARR